MKIRACHLASSFLAAFFVFAVCLSGAALANVTCTSLPCTYPAQVGQNATVSGEVISSPQVISIKTELHIEQTVGTLNLEMTTKGDDIEIYAELSRLGYNSFGIGTLGPLSFNTVAVGAAPGGTLPHMDINNAVLITAFFTGISESYLEATMPGKGSEDGGAGGGSSSATEDGGDTCGDGEPGDSCHPLADDLRELKLGCDGPITSGGFTLIPFFPIPNPFVVFGGGGAQPPDITDCCAAHDICYINGGACEEDRVACDDALRDCVIPLVPVVDWPWAEAVLGGIRLGGNDYFNKNPRGCRCKLEMPPKPKPVAGVTGPHGGDATCKETQEPEQTCAAPENGDETPILPEHDAVLILHADCCEDGECKEDQACAGILMKKVPGSSTGHYQVGTIPGKCKDYGGPIL